MSRERRRTLVPEIDGFLHEPARLRLMAYLSVLARADFVYLLRHSGLSRGNLSTQMTRLAEAGYVEIEKTFEDSKPRTTYRLTAAGRAALRSYKRDLAAVLEALPD